MPKKLTLEEVSKYLEERECVILSKEYKGNKYPLELNCMKCGDIYFQTLDRIKRGYVHPGCSANENKTCIYNGNTPIKQKRVFVCKYEDCKKEFNPKRSSSVFCSKECINGWLKNSKEWKDQVKKYGSKGGKMSANDRRSKNEILFADMCIDYFGNDNVSTNKSMFEGFDADVIIEKYKIAIEWNGVWHYKQVKKGHNLKQVQARDVVKKSVITKKYGYELYVVKDMGGYSKNFVESEFSTFKKYFEEKFGKRNGEEVNPLGS